MNSKNLQIATVGSALPQRTAVSLAVAAVGLLISIATATAGTITAFRYPSPALGQDASANVYVPSGQTPNGKWPVLYLLHGLNGAPGDWVSLGDIAATLDRMIAAKRIQPLVVVMPDGKNSWYVDSADVGGPGNFATSIGRDLPAAIEAAFAVGTDRLHRAIGGISMGGYGALRLGLTSPDRYVAIATLSPAIWQNIPTQSSDAKGVRHDHSPTAVYFQKVDPDTVTIGVDAPPEGSHFGTAFGTPFDPQRFNAANVFTILEDAVERKKHLPSIFVSVGDDDSHRLWRGSIAFFETMQMNNLDVEFRVTDGDHNWTLWKKSIEDALLFVDSRFTKPADR